MSSKYLAQVLGLVKELYPGADIRQEQNLGLLCHGVKIPEDLQLLLGKAKTELNKLRVDIYVVGQVAIEVHGEQHEQAIQFSNEIQDIHDELERRKLMDNIKQQALLLAGIPTIVIWWSTIDSLTTDKLQNYITKAQLTASNRPAQSIRLVKSPKYRTQDEAFKKRQLERARRYRRDKYKRAKTHQRNRRRQHK